MRISSVELWAAMFMFMVGSTIVLPMGAVAGRDSWISLVLATAGGAGIGWIYAYLCQSHPGKSIVEIGELLLGKWTGRSIGLLYAWYGFHLGTLVLRNFEELTLTVALPRTPVVAVSVPLIAIVLWAAYQGMEVIARCSQAVVGFIVFTIAISFILLLSDLDSRNLLPILDKGWPPVLEGAVQMTTFPFGETVLFAMVLSGLNKVKQTKRTVLWAIAAGGLLLLAAIVRNILVFDGLASKLLFPSYSALAYISVADFIERIEPLTFLVFVFGGFIKISVCLYVSALSLAQTLRTEEHRTYLFPLAVLMIEFSRLVYDNQAEMILFATDVWPWYSVPFQIFIPLTLLTVTAIRQKKGVRRRRTAS